MTLLVAALEMMGPRSTISSGLGLVAGTWGIIYGLKAKSFTAYGRFTSREAHSFAPNWGHRLLVVTISATAADSFYMGVLRSEARIYASLETVIAALNKVDV
jgi:hypothetical protein